MKKILIYTMVSVLGIFMSCDVDQEFILQGPTLISSAEGEQMATHEPGNEVYLEFTLQAASGLAYFEITRDGEVYDYINYSDEISSTYIFSFIVPQDTPIGTGIDFRFRLVDKGNRDTFIDYNINVDATFFVTDDVINGTPVRIIKGRLNSDYLLESDITYLVDSTVSVENNSTLTIESGSTIYFKTYPQQNLFSRLVIARGSKIMAEGIPGSPIVCTSDKILYGETPTSRDWGGIFLFGSSPNNQGENVLESGFRYGGNIPNDNSGIMSYVRIEYAGKNGMHGLHLSSVGSGTQISNIQVYRNENTSFRVKGGRVSLKYIAGIGHGGYGIWADAGWQGNGQFWIFQTDIQATLVPVNFWNQARSIELRNDENFFLREPRTTFRISNVTLIGNGHQDGSDNGTRRGVRVRRGATGILQNSIITQFPDDGVRVEDLDVSELGTTMILDNTRAFNNNVNYAQDAVGFFFGNPDFNVTEDPVSGITTGNFVGSQNSIFNPNSMGSFFTSAPYIGAVESSSNDWTTQGGWFKDLNGMIR